MPPALLSQIAIGDGLLAKQQRETTGFAFRRKLCHSLVAAAKRIVITGLLAVASSLGPNAANVTTTIPGTMYSGTDASGVFGPPNTDLTGKSFTLTFTFDDTKGVQNTTPCIESTTSSITETTASNPGTAVLQISTGKFAFGTLANATVTSSAYRSLGCTTANNLVNVLGSSVHDSFASGSEVEDAVFFTGSVATGTIPAGDSNWEDALATSLLEAQQPSTGFYISPESILIGPSANGTFNPETITISGPQTGGSGQNSSALQFVSMTPCRVADTRNATGPFGGPELGAVSSREFDIPKSACSIPSSAVAYSLNVTAVPNGSLGYLTMWPSGQAQPTASTLNSDGRVKANAAIVPAGTNGGVSVYVTDPTNVVLDIDGYFAPAGTASALAFYPVTPCRIADTRNASGPFGGPTLAGNSSRSFPIQSSSCGLPSGAQAYSLNVTAVPKGPLGYLTLWPSGQSQPQVSTLNASTGAVTANAAFVPAGSGGNVSVFVSDTSDVVLDVNGYFAAPGASGLSFYTSTSCRVLDTRNTSGAFNGVLGVNVEGSPCAPSSTAQAYVLNGTVVPLGGLNYLTLWPAGEAQPTVSTLNASDGVVTSNMAVVPTINGSIDAFSSNPTQLILDLSGYFAPLAR